MEVRASAARLSGKEHSRQQEEQVQSPAGPKGQWRAQAKVGWRLDGE